MEPPIMLGKWLLQAPRDDEATESFICDRTDNVFETLICILESWDEITDDATPSDASQLIWCLLCNPFWLTEYEFEPEEWNRVCQAASIITHSIPRIHDPGEPMETGFHMLWDLLSHTGLDAVSYLAELVVYPDPRMKLAALHGLGHQGDARIPVIQKHQARLEEMFGKEYVLECLEGRVM